MRIGHGYDVHRLVEGRDLILGGVAIPHTTGLLGHSDADVLVHAVMDSILGALALGDIGKLFPDNDPQYSNADSVVLLQQVITQMKLAGYKISNLDATVVAQKPKISPYIPSMKETLCKAMEIEFHQLNIKATTEEGLGFTGREEGIAAHCVCLLERV